MEAGGGLGGITLVQMRRDGDLNMVVVVKNEIDVLEDKANRT